MVYRLLAFITIKRKLNNYFFKWHNIFNILVASAPHKSVINNHKKSVFYWGKFMSPFKLNNVAR